MYIYIMYIIIQHIYLLGNKHSVFNFLDIFGVLHSNSIYNLCTTFLAKEEYVYLHVIIIQYGVNLEEKNFKVMMMNNEENITENILIYILELSLSKQ